MQYDIVVFRLRIDIIVATVFGVSSIAFYSGTPRAKSLAQL